MAKGFVWQQLCKRAYWGVLHELFILGCMSVIVAAPLFLLLCGFGVRSEIAAILAVGFILTSIAFLIVWAVRSWPEPLERHPDICGLKRYGQPAEVLAAIERELADKRTLLRLSLLHGSFRASSGVPWRVVPGDLYLTPSWMIYATDLLRHRMTFLRLDDVILVYRREGIASDETMLPSFGLAIIVADRFGVELTIPVGEAGATRLMAELLTRLPWVWDHFDSETERIWAEDRHRIVTAVDRRRETIK